MSVTRTIVRYICPVNKPMVSRREIIRLSNIVVIWRVCYWHVMFFKLMAHEGRSLLDISQSQNALVLAHL